MQLYTQIYQKKPKLHTHNPLFLVPNSFVEATIYSQKTTKDASRLVGCMLLEGRVLRVKRRVFRGLITNKLILFQVSVLTYLACSEKQGFFSKHKNSESFETIDHELVNFKKGSLLKITSFTFGVSQCILLNVIILVVGWSDIVVGLLPLIFLDCSASIKDQE